MLFERPHAHVYSLSIKTGHMFFEICLPPEDSIFVFKYLEKNRFQENYFNNAEHEHMITGTLFCQSFCNPALTGDNSP